MPSLSVTLTTEKNLTHYRILSTIKFSLEFGTNRQKDLLFSGFGVLRGETADLDLGSYIRCRGWAGTLDGITSYFPSLEYRGVRRCVCLLTLYSKLSGSNGRFGIYSLLFLFLK